MAQSQAATARRCDLLTWNARLCADWSVLLSQALLMCRFLGVPFSLVAPPPVGNWAPTSGAIDTSARDAFLRIAPLGQVPVLLDPNCSPEESGGAAGGVVVRDSAAIVTYIARKYGDPSWTPTEPLSAARVMKWLSYSAAEVNNSLLKVRISLLFSWDIAPQTVEGALDASRTVLKYIDTQIAEGEAHGHEWLVPGPRPTIADVCVFPYVAYAEDSSKGALHLGDYPALSRWLARFKALPGYVAPPGL
jgi:glutathione S-transferase